MTAANQAINLNITRLDIEGPTPNDTLPCPYDSLKVMDIIILQPLETKHLTL